MGRSRKPLRCKPPGVRIPHSPPSKPVDQAFSSATEEHVSRAHDVANDQHRPRRGEGPEARARPRAPRHGLRQAIQGHARRLRHRDHRRGASSGSRRRCCSSASSTPRSPRRTRSMLAVLAGLVVAAAVGSAVLGLFERYWSSRVGEGLIYDLRTQLFDHVQRLPLSFFTRTQTGALVSRLNNDVIGAQRALHRHARHRRLERDHARHHAHRDGRARLATHDPRPCCCSRCSSCRRSGSAASSPTSPATA